MAKHFILQFQISKLGLMRNLKAITKKNIELHAAKVSQISEFIEKLLSESGDVTTATIRKENKEKQKLLTVIWVKLRS